MSKVQTKAARSIECALILNSSPCDTNLYGSGPSTLTEARRLGIQICPHHEACEHGDFMETHQCAMRWGVEVAKNALTGRTSVAQEMREFRQEHHRQSGGWVWSDDRAAFTIITDDAEACRKVEQFASMLLPSKTYPEVGPTLNDVTRYATTSDGAIDLIKMQELEGRFGSNGGRGCDVRSGPCSCGAWH